MTFLALLPCLRCSQVDQVPYTIILRVSSVAVV